MLIKMNKKFYIAYGSNLSVEQMAIRAPDAELAGTATLKDMRLIFKTHATVEPCENCEVPCLVWRISEHDERNLDNYENWPKYYIKKFLEINIKPFEDNSPSFKANAMIYIMTDGRSISQPSKEYYKTIEACYEKFNFNKNILYKALKSSII